MDRTLAVSFLLVLICIGSVATPVAATRPSNDAAGTPMSAMQSDNETVEAPDYQRDGFRSTLVFQFTVQEDGSALVTFQVNYVPDGASVDSQDDYPLQNESAYEEFEREVDETMEAFVAETAAAEERDMELVEEGTQHTYSEGNSMIYRWKYRWHGFAESDGDTLIVDEPFASGPALLENTRTTLYAYPFWTAAQEYYVTDVTDAHRDRVNWAHDYPYVIEFQQHQNDYEGFNVVFEPTPEETTHTERTTPTAATTTTTTPTTENSPHTQTTMSTPDPSESSSPSLTFAVATLVALLLVALAIWRTRNRE